MSWHYCSADTSLCHIGFTSLCLPKYEKTFFQDIRNVSSGSRLCWKWLVNKVPRFGTCSWIEQKRWHSTAVLFDYCFEAIFFICHRFMFCAQKLFEYPVEKKIQKRRFRVQRENDYFISFLICLPKQKTQLQARVILSNCQASWDYFG